MSILYPRAKPYFSDTDVDDILDEIKDTLQSGNLVQGKKVKEFEDKFAKMVGTKYAIATNSCTSALELTLKSLGIKKGKKIPASKLNAAAKKGGKLGQRARFAKTLARLRRKK